MGNCSAFLRAVKAKPDQKVIQVVKTDGKILEFRAPLLVKDVLVKFSGSGIGLSTTVSHHLPMNYELKMGKVYYILPATEPPSTAVGTGGSVKRIKVVITKQELQQLLAKQVSVQEVLAGLEKRNGSFVVSPRNWKPKLDSILEENDQ
ncbi:Glutaminase-asparaginase [Gossypium australe]|uniref:Glutaminase-asparaginase n=1 Tax=Gossypium australe TaxID=47621 RepID=A0A5B6UR95_9ROSI|nr:Glutaminase-asparaginase [Gossypium australe]